MVYIAVCTGFLHLQTTRRNMTLAVESDVKQQINLNPHYSSLDAKCYIENITLNFLMFVSRARIHERSETFVLGLVVFTKNIRPVLGFAKGSTLRLVRSGLKFFKKGLNMAAINFSLLQNFKWL